MCKCVMAKIMFVDNCSATAISGKAMVISKMYDLISGKFHTGDIIALIPGHQYVDSFQGHEYVCHKVLTFDSNEQPSSIELLAKSAHSFSSYGATADVQKPRVGTKTSKSGHLIPDLEFINSQSPFRFKVVTIGKDAEGNELVDATVDQIQYAKVTGFATYWVAEYGADMDVLLDDKVAALESGEKPCRMKYVKKPIFEIIVPSSKVKKVVTDFISAE